jgi:peptidoglycan/LPS O-acetylase OafA/YrhL
MTAPSKPGFIPRLESLRGLAAVSVLAYHSFSQFIDTNVTGMAPVVLFFVLSGFVLARSLTNNPSPKEFFRHRLFRLFPAAAFVVLLLTGLHSRFGLHVGYEANFDPLNIVLNALMIRHDINGVMWSMTVECFATPLIFLSVWTFKTHGSAPLLALVALLFGLSFVGSYAHLLGGVPLYAFIVGILLHFEGAYLADKVQRWPAAVAIAAVTIFCFCGLKKQTAPIILLEVFSSGTLVLLIAFLPDAQMFRFLDAVLVRFYGRISYSFYLLHPAGLMFATMIIGGFQAPSIAIASVTAVALMITTPLAWLSWRCVEMPFIVLGKRFDLSPHETFRSTGPVQAPKG